MNWIKRLFGIKEKELPKLEDFSKKKERVRPKNEVYSSGPMSHGYGSTTVENHKAAYDPLTDPLNPLSPFWIGASHDNGCYNLHSAPIDNAPSTDTPSHYDAPSHSSNDYSSHSDSSSYHGSSDSSSYDSGSSSYDSGSSYDSSSSSDSSSW